MKGLSLLFVAFVICCRSSHADEKASGESIDAAWDLCAIVREGVPVTLPSDYRANIKFRKDGSVSGRAGVNHYSSRYELHGESIEWTAPIKVTRKAGPSHLMEIESVFIGLLNHADRLKEEGHRWLLVSENDQSKSILKFQAAE